MNNFQADISQTSSQEPYVWFLLRAIEISLFLSIAAALTWHNPFVMTHFAAIIAKYNVFLKWCGVLSNYTPETNLSIFKQL